MRNRILILLLLLAAAAVAQPLRIQLVNRSHSHDISDSHVVVIQLGHGREAHEKPNYRKLARNAILWSAGKLS